MPSSTSILGALAVIGFASASVGTLRSQETRFAFIRTAVDDQQRALRYLDACRQETGAFARLIAAIPASEPLTTTAAETSSGMNFGGSYDTESLAPVFTLVFHDLDLLPTASTVRTWSSDSNWAFTRCEVIGHELAEAIEYREQWQARPADETKQQARIAFEERHRRSHRVALEAEEAIANEQHTRVDVAQRPYARSRECFVNGTVLVIFGANTEALVYKHGALTHPLYYPNTDLCSLP